MEATPQLLARAKTMSFQELAKMESAILMARINGSILDEPKKPRVRVSTTKDRIMAYLHESGERSTDQICRDLGMLPKTLADQLRKLREMGKINSRTIARGCRLWSVA